MTRRDKGIFRICEHGFAHWAHPHLMTGEEANRLADSTYPDCHVLPYWQAKAMLDPDTLSEPALRRRMGLPEHRPAMAITGKVPGMTRKEAIEIAESKGYRVVSSVSSGTRLVVYGEGGGRKANDARRAGIPLKSWRQFVN